MVGEMIRYFYEWEDGAPAHKLIERLMQATVADLAELPNRYQEVAADILSMSAQEYQIDHDPVVRKKFLQKVSP